MPFNTDTQVRYQIHLIRKKLYKPLGLDDDLNSYYERPDKMPCEIAKKIFEHMKKKSSALRDSPGIRGRTSMAPLMKMGLVTKGLDGKINVTVTGNNFLNGKIDLGEAMLNYAYKWSLPNPTNNRFSKKRGFDIRPFVSTIMLINKVNGKWAGLGYKPVGISKEEFSVFVPTMINYKDIDQIVEKIIELRKKTRGRKRKEQKEIKKKFFFDYIENFSGTSNCAKYYETLKDYGDNTIRYFVLTRFFYIRGNEYYIDIEKQKSVEINSLLRESDGRSIQFETAEEYIGYMSDNISFPWENVEELQLIAENLQRNITEINTHLNMSMEKRGIYWLTKEGLIEEIKRLRELKRKIQQKIDKERLQNPLEFKKAIDDLENIYTAEFRAINLEYLVTLCLNGINDAEKIKPNYPVGDDNRPTFTAPANMTDIECLYVSFSMICEVTMLRSRNQWISEGQPVMRHLRDFEEKIDNETYCLFIAPDIHRDTFNTFSISNRYGYEGSCQKIIPIRITQFIEISKMAMSKQIDGVPVRHEEFKNILERLYCEMNNTKDVKEWNKRSTMVIDNICKRGE